MISITLEVNQQKIKIKVKKYKRKEKKRQKNEEMKPTYPVQETEKEATFFLFNENTINK